MPTDGQLSWAEIRDFSAGLWTVNDQLIPPNGAQVMTDCFPSPAGGLRAWFKATSFTTSGISNTTLERPRFLFAHENYDGAGHNDNYLLTYNTSDTRCRLYRMDEASSAVWTQIQLHAGGNDPGTVHPTAFINSSGVKFLVYSLGAAQGADNGSWSVRNDTGAISHFSTFGSYAFNYQSRICSVQGSTIQYSDPGGFTNFDTNIAPVDINEGQPNIMFVATFSPGDLIVFKEGAPIYLVEGDLFNYSVRQMNGSKPVQIGGPNVVRGPQGVIFRAGSDGIYETPDGSMLNPLSQALSSQEWTTTAGIVWSHHWLLSFANARVLDYDSKGWFTTSILPSGAGVAFPLPRLGGVFFSDNGAPFTLWKVIPSDGRTDNRAESYTWKSSPLRDPSGRQIEVRAVQVVAKSTNGATSTITVTVNGVARTIACDSGGRGSITYYFLARRETLDIQVDAASNASGVEAPRIEALRIGTQGGHFLTTGADVG